jgi:uncharacterized membrane protein YdjX (TVP38/TMEM64 family)
MLYKNVGESPASSWRLSSLVRRPDFWLLIIGVAALATGLWWVSAWLIGLIERAAGVRSFVADAGPLAPVLYSAVFAAQILIAPLPGQFLGVMSGYLFGAFWGSLYSIIGLTVGAGLAMLIARRYGRPLLERFADATEISRWERKLRMRSAATWALLFILPVPDFAFYVAGLSRVPLQQLLLAVIAGRGIGLIFANVVGTLSATLPAEWVIVKWLIIGLLSLAMLRYQRVIRLGLLLALRWYRRTLRRWRRSLLLGDQP